MSYLFEKLLRLIKRLVGEHIISLIAFVLSLGGRRIYDYITQGLSARQFSSTNETKLKIKIHSPDYLSPDSNELKIINRIFTAYKRAKNNQAHADPIFTPSSLWKDQLEHAYSPLLKGLEANDITEFHYFLTNFGSWKISTGIENSGVLQAYAANKRTIKYFENKMVAPSIQWWRNNESQGRGLEALTHPMFGNQPGAFVNGHFMTIGSLFSDIYGRLISGLINTDRPIIGEIGGGYGKLFYFISREVDNFCYLDFDLPEVLCCASYFLLKTFPNKKFILYGEENLTKSSLQEYDFILLPSFEISKLPEESIDMFINVNSLGEMKPATAKYFIREICRTAKQFFHANHEIHRNIFTDNTASLLNREYPIPSNQFELVVRYPEICHAIYHGSFDSNSDIYWYFYKRTQGED